ncbi:MAG: PPC domain-containing protein [Planctomycetaceae bacterium]
MTCRWSDKRIDPRRAIAALSLLTLLACVDSLSAAPPTLSYLFPAGGQRGTKVAATLTGDFPWPVSVWAPGVEVTAAEEKGKLEISIPEDLYADRIWLRLHSAEGASAIVPFLIGNLLEVNEVEPNNNPKNAQTLSQAQVIVNGALQGGGDVDGFAVELTAGQTLVASVDANGKLGSPVDAVIQIAAPAGNVLAENHDDVAFDPRLAYTATKTGTHIVRVFGFSSTANTTIAFQGDASYIYRLTITTGPFVTYAAPSSVSLAEPGNVEVFGWNIPPGTKIPVLPFGRTRLNEHQEFETLDDLRNSTDDRIGLVFAPGLAGSTRVRLAAQTGIPSIAQGDAANPMPLTLPNTVVGMLRDSKQKDVYRLPLKAGQPIVLAVESRSIESLLDPPLLKLTDPAGNIAAQVIDQSPARASIISHTAAQDGDYQLQIRSRFRQGGDRCFYRLTARQEESDFELTAGADSIVVTHDKPTELAVTIIRRTGPEGAIGPITIEAVGLPEGVTAVPVVSDVSGDTAGTVKLSFTTTGAAFSGPIRLMGTAVLPREIKRFIRTPPKLSASIETFWLTSVVKP